MRILRNEYGSVYQRYSVRNSDTLILTKQSVTQTNEEIQTTPEGYQTILLFI